MSPPEHVVNQGHGMISQTRGSVKDRGWCPRGGGQSRTGGGVPKRVVSQGQGWCPRGGGQSRTGGGVPEEVVSQGQGMVSQSGWSTKDRGCPPPHSMWSIKDMG